MAEITVTLDVRRGEGNLENLAALVAEGYELAAADGGYVVLRRRGLRLQRQAPPPAPDAPSAVEGE